MDDAVEFSLLDQLAEDFLIRHRRGERPSIADYMGRYPELAAGIGDLFSTLLAVEEARPGDASISADRLRGISLFQGDEADGLDDYRIIREVGRGGMGIVYEAEQLSLGRRVALKVLPKHAALSDRQVERFHREARAVARLHHTNIVSVFSVGEHENAYFHAMQFIEGHSLDEVLVEVTRLRQNGKRRAGSSHSVSVHPGEQQRTDDVSVEEAAGILWKRSAESDSAISAVGDAQSHHLNSHHRPQSMRLPVYESSTAGSESCYWLSVARIGIQVAEALAYAAREGVLHRDIKPSNLMLDMRGMVWVTDFGLAKALGSDDLTRTGDIVGTLRYMAPERFRGQSDQRSDIYGLGVTLYELITLRHPFDTNDRHRLVRQIEQTEPARPRAIDRTVPRDLETIVLKAMAKHPGDRYANAELMANDLRLFLSGQPIMARPVGVLEWFWRWCRRNPALASLIATVLLLCGLLASSAVVTKMFRDERDVALRNLNRAVAAERLANENQRRAQLAERQVTIQSHLARAAAIRRSGEMGQRFRCLDYLQQAAELDTQAEYRDQLNDEAIAAFLLTDLRVEQEHAIENIVGLQFSDSLDRYVYVDMYQQRETVICELAENREVLRLPAPEFRFWHASADFSPDGRYVYVVYYLSGSANNHPVLHVWNLASAERVLEQRILSGDVYAGVTMTASRLVFVNEQSELCVIDLDTDEEVTRFFVGVTPSSICVDSRGRRVAINDYNKPLLRIMDLETGAELASWTHQVGRCGMDWSDDDQLLACGDNDGQIYVWHVPSLKLSSILESESSVIFLRFARHGYLLASCCWEDETRLWDAATGQELLRAIGKPLKFSPNDRSLAFIRGLALGTWEVAHGTESRMVFPPSLHGATVLERRIQGAEFSDDGRLLAIYGRSGVWLWNRQTGEELGAIPGGPADQVLFRDGGKGLIVNSKERGVEYWPFQWSADDDRDLLTVGPRAVIHPRSPSNQEAFSIESVAWLPDQLGVVVIDNVNARVQVIEADPTFESFQVVASLPSRHRRMTNVAASPNGEWIAVGGFKESGIQVWNVADRQLTTVLPHGGGSFPTRYWVYFSGDNRWLVCGSDVAGYQTYHVGSWEHGPKLGHTPNTRLSVDTSDDGKTLAFSQTPNQAIITSSDLEDPVLRLPTTRTAMRVSLSHDGSECATAVEKGPLVWWNLRRVKAGLAQLGNATASSPIEESSSSQHDPWSPGLRPRRIELRITDELAE